MYCKVYEINHDEYEDDTQLYVSDDKLDLLSGVGAHKLCAEVIHTWLYHNGLALNPSETEAI